MKECVQSYTLRSGQSSKVHQYLMSNQLTYTCSELHILRDLLMHKYGREFALGVMENRDGCVSKRVGRDDPTKRTPY